MAATNLEQLLLELVNETRLDPAGSAARYITSYSPLQSNDPDIQSALNFFDVSGTVLQSAFNALVPVGPVAWNEALASAARGHSQVMIANNVQSHQLPGEPDFGVRATNAGYDWNLLGENIFAFSRSAIHAHAGFMVDWGSGPNGMQSPPGHRDNIMDADFREVGIGILAESNPATSVGPLVITQDFGRQSGAASNVILLGVAYNDGVTNDDFYSVGEGVAGLHVALGAAGTDTAASGGYALTTTATGSQTVTFSGGGLAGNITVTATLSAGSNYKIDVVDPGTASPVLQTSVSATVGGAAAIIKGLGTVGLTLSAGAGAQTVLGTRGNDTLSGGAGADSLVGGAGNDTYIADAGDSLAEAANGGTDTVNVGASIALPVNFEHLLLLAGSGAIEGSGNGGANSITGNESANRLSGDAGNDTLLGGGGADVFAYGPGGGGDRVGDFSRAQGDRIDLTAFGTIHSVAQLMASATVTDTAAGVRLAFATADTLTLTGVVRSSLADGDFIFLQTGSAPEDIALTVDSVTENSLPGTVVGVLSASDPDPGETFTFRLMNNAGGRFSVSGSNLAVVGAIDFEAATSHEVLVRVTDAAGNTFDEAMTIAVVNVGGASITGSAGNDLVGAAATVAGQPLPTVEEDVILGLAGNDTLDGLAGNDGIEGGPGDDRLTGGAGIDTLSYAGAAAGVSVSLAVTTAQDTKGAGRDLVLLFENLIGGAGNDSLTGSGGANVMVGGAGSDSVRGSAGADSIDGGEGDDLIEGGAGADLLAGGTGGETRGDTVSYAASLAGVSVSLAANPQAGPGDSLGDQLTGFENLMGSALADLLSGDGGANAIAGLAGADTLSGGGGTDTLDYSASTAAVTVTLGAGGAQATGAGGHAAGDRVSGFENVTGSAMADRLGGNELANTILGGAGNDTIQGGAGADTLDGGAGLNTLSYADDTAGVTVRLGNPAGSGGHAQGDSLLNFAHLIGGSGNDDLGGSLVASGAGNNRIEGGLGNDTVEGGFGDDVLIGGGTLAAPGSDTVSYENAAAGARVSLAVALAQNTVAAGRDTLAGFENLSGSAFDDGLTGNGFANAISGGSGNDTLQGGAGADTLDGGLGSDTVSYGASALGVVVDLEAAPQATTNGTAANGDATGDSLSGFENLVGSARADTLTGDTGDNVIEGGAGNDTLSGGDGTDTVSYASATLGVTASLALGTATGGAGNDALQGFENVLGSAFADRLSGNELVNAILGGAGNDTIQGGAGADTLDGGAGLNTLSYADDTTGVTVRLGNPAGSGGHAQGDSLLNFAHLTGGSGNDNLSGSLVASGADNNRIEGGLGNDTVEGGFGDDVLIGGGTLAAPGSDTVSYENAAAGVRVSLAVALVQNTVGAGRDTLAGFENLSGSAFDDGLTGNGFANAISGGNGNDTLQGGAGADTLDGGLGSDTVSYGASALGVVVDLEATPQATTNGTAANGDATGDSLSGFENLVGSARADTLTGDTGDNVIEGAAGNDTLSGGAGTDTVSYASATLGVTASLALGTATGGAGSDALQAFENLTGGRGADRLSGDAGGNVITGGLGADTLTGAGGDDIFVFDSLAERGDRIADFTAGDLLQIDHEGFAGLALAALADGQTFVSGGTPLPSLAQATFLYDTDDGSLYYDDDGTAAHARLLLVTLDGHPGLAASDLAIL